MANLKETRSRISSVMSTQQITKAMKLVSATKLRKAQMAITQMRPYAEKLSAILGNLSGSIEDASLAKYFEQREVNKVLLVVITSDRGLCGAFNSNIIKKTKHLLINKYGHLPKEKVSLMFIGKKGADILGKLGYPTINDYKETFHNLTSENVFSVADNLLSRFTEKEFDKVELIYNQFVNAATQIVKEEQYLPVNIETIQGTDKAAKSDYIFEPSKVEILEDLVPRSLKTQVYKSLLDSFASEHGARMVAMDKATENAGELLKSLRLSYNQARQAAITTELSEIVGGAAALAG